jgi:two-component system heavy metal sensor histidine kinase CusS
LTAWYAGSSFALVLLATGIVYLALVDGLARQDDASLARKAHALRGVLRERSTPIALRQEAEWAGEGLSHARVLVRILDANGKVLAETRGLSDALPPEAFPAPVPSDAEPGSGAWARSPAGQPFRVLAVRAVVGRAGPERIIQVALDCGPQEAMLARYRRTLAVVLAIALLACTVAGYRIARRGLRPVEDITRLTGRIQPTNLEERLSTAGMPAELLKLAGTFNAMLERLESAFARLARFSADIAHELRTPVNNLRGAIEVALGKARSPEEYRDVLGSCLEDTARLTRIIDCLLFLARAESPSTQVEREAVDVGRELVTVQEFYEAAAAEVGVRLTVETAPELLADLNRPLLQRAVGNLIENALTHTRAGGSIALRARLDNGSVCVEVEDTGCGIAAEHLPHVFERFYRADAARTSSGRVGLGLAIVKGIVDLHGGSVALTSEVGNGARIVLSFPARPKMTKP